CNGARGIGRTYCGDPVRPDLVAVDALLARVGEGGTLILEDAQRCLAGMAFLCRVLMAESGFEWHVAIYATPPGGAGFPAHSSEKPVFILQLSGARQWTWARVPTSPATGGGSGDGDWPTPEEWVADSDTADLQEGDMLYLPAGTTHAAKAGGAGSVHAALTCALPTWDQICEGVQHSSRLETLNFGFHREPERLSEGLCQRGVSCGSAGHVDAYLAGLAERFRPDMSGRLTDLLSPRRIRPDTVVRPRPDLLWWIASGDDGAVLICGSIRLAFPERVRPAVDQLLRRGGRPAALPGDLSDAERLDVTAMLVDHALVHRVR
ncbi:MAG: cupin domain-containing protein, partial [Pseudomonadota bacterium]